MQPHLLIIDHDDSFTYNLVHLFREAGAKTTVLPFDQTDPSQTRPEDCDGIVFSPGPGCVLNPSDVGFSRSIIRKWQGKIPMLGVCLGHQLIAHHCGGTIKTIEPAHGKRDSITIASDSQLLQKIPSNRTVMRYHSQIVLHNPFPELLKITATNKDGIVMAFENPIEKLYGVQFHPESIGTPHGNQIAENFVDICRNITP